MISTMEEFLAFLEQNGYGRYIPFVEKYGDTFTFQEFYNQFGQTEMFRSIFEQFEAFKEQAAQTTSSLVVSDGMTVVIGFSVVFVVLLALTAIFYLFGFVMDKINKPTKKAASSAAPAAAAPTVHRPVQSAAPVQNGVTGEVVAAISAAVAMMAPEGKQYVVKSVSPKNTNSRSAWAAAGIADNTRPF